MSPKESTMLNYKHSIPAPTRRILRASALTAASIGLFVPAPIFAQTKSPVLKINEAAAKSDITVQRLRGNVRLLMGSGGNIVAFTGPEGKLLIDAGIAVSQSKIEAALSGISLAPLKYVINTHWHWDHTDGNGWAHRSGATIIAHENVLKRLSTRSRVEDWNYTFPATSQDHRPTLTFNDDIKLRFNGETIALQTYGHGHTDGDISAYFSKADVLVLGDIFWNGYYPFIDNAWGGGINDMIRWTNAALARTTNKTLIIPGHGPVGNRAQLIAYRDMMVAIRSKVARLKKQGKTLNQVIAAKPTAAYDAKWGRFVIDPAFFTRLVYAGV
jgi:glyoxylase-like metal-dependent hydrolase (beta-lactamase superfamily II)